jgi:hypothetical protein
VACSELDVSSKLRRSAELVDSLPNATYRTLPSRAHLPYLEAADEVAALVPPTSIASISMRRLSTATTFLLNARVGSRSRAGYCQRRALGALPLRAKTDAGAGTLCHKPMIR